jgi:hypothetical protein
MGSPVPHCTQAFNVLRASCVPNGNLLHASAVSRHHPEMYPWDHVCLVSAMGMMGRLLGSWAGSAETVLHQSTH